MVSMGCTFRLVDELRHRRLQRFRAHHNRSQYANQSGSRSLRCAGRRSARTRRLSLPIQAPDYVDHRLRSRTSFGPGRPILDHSVCHVAASTRPGGSYVCATSQRCRNRCRCRRTSGHRAFCSPTPGLASFRHLRGCRSSSRTVLPACATSTAARQAAACGDKPMGPSGATVAASSTPGAAALPIAAAPSRLIRFRPP